MNGNEEKQNIFTLDMTPSVRKKSNVIVRGTSLIFDEIRIAKDEENQMKSLDEIEEENGDESSRYLFILCITPNNLQSNYKVTIKIFQTTIS